MATKIRGGTPAPEPQSSGKWDDSRMADYAENLARGYRRSSPAARQAGHDFYPAWNEDAQHFGQRSATTTEHGAVALAISSPQTHEAINRMQALQLLHVDDKQEHAIRTAYENRSLAATAKREGHMDEFAYHDAMAKHFRAKAGLQGTPLNINRSNHELSRMLDVRNNAHPNPLSQLDGKIGDYGGAIADPRGYQRIAGDTHIYHAAVGGGNHAIQYDDNGGLFGNKRVYEGLQTVHRLAYHSNIELGHVNPDLTSPNAHMGSIWFDHRDQKMASNADSAKSALARRTTIHNLLNHPLGAQWDPARNGLRPIKY